MTARKVGKSAAKTVPKQAGNRGLGRKKGVPNKATALAREAIAKLVDGNAERLQEWLDQIAKQDGPKAAFQCLTDLLEYHIPKLARSEITGKDGSPIKTEDVTAPRPRLAPREWLLAHGVDLQEIADVGPATRPANVRTAG